MTSTILPVLQKKSFRARISCYYCKHYKPIIYRCHTNTLHQLCKDCKEDYQYSFTINNDSKNSCPLCNDFTLTTMITTNNNCGQKMNDTKIDKSISNIGHQEPIIIERGKKYKLPYHNPKQKIYKRRYEKNKMDINSYNNFIKEKNGRFYLTDKNGDIEAFLGLITWETNILLSGFIQRDQQIKTIS